MSTTVNPSHSAHYVDFDEYVDLKLQKTRSTIKSTDLLVALAGVAAMFLGYLLVFVVLDQWVVPGGFSIGLRWVLLSTLLVGTIAWLVWKVGRPYFRSVNRLFAAREIERSEPAFKSNLLNLVDLRASGRDVDPTVLKALEKHAAVQLQQIDVTQAIDHRPLMRTAYVLLAIVVMFCLYALFSPKNISNSIWRGLLPPADISVATRTEILNVEPGDSTVLARTRVEVFADIAGEIPPKVYLHFTTADGKFKDEPVELRTDAEGQTRFKGWLNGENGQGVLQDMTYVVRAGDAVSKEFRITVEQPPSAAVDKVHYEFPAYMKLEPTESLGGQIDSWEGVKVTLNARTNMRVKSGLVEFLDDAQAAKSNGEEVPMTVSSDGRQLEAKWTLGFRSDDSYAKFYRVQCKTETGATDPAPTVYAIVIRKDLPPEVALLEPVRDVEAPANAIIPLLIQARDPDFELSHINLLVEKDGQQVHKESLSDTKQPRAMLKHDLALDRLVLKAGDQIEFWVEAFDNKQPRPNRKNTPRLKVRIIEPVSQKEAQKQLAEDQKQRDQRMAEAQQEQNADGRSDQSPADDAANPPPRAENDQPPPDRDPNRRDAQQPNDDNQPQDGKNGSKDQAGEKGNTKGQAQPNGDSGKSERSDGKSEDATKGDPKGEGSKDSGANGQKQKPLSPDGDDDQTALQKLIERLNQPRDNKSGDENNSRDESTSEPKSGQPSKGQNGPKEPNKDGSRSDDANATELKSDGNRTPREGDPMPNAGPNEDGSRDPKQPMPKDSTGEKPAPKDGTPNETTTNEKPQPGEGSDGKKPMPKQEGSANDPNAQGTPDKPQTAKDKVDPDKNGSKSTGEPNTDPNAKGDQPKVEPTRNPKTNDAGQPSKEQPQKGTANEPTNADDKTAKPDTNTGMPDQKGTDNKQPGPGNKTDAAPPKKEGPNGNKQNDPKADGPREQTGDSPDAVKKDATGDEKGTAKPDSDPNAKPTPKKGDGLTRDPNEKPQTRPGTTKNDDSSTANDDPKTKPDRTKPPGQKPDPNIEQQPTEPGTAPMPQQTEKRDGDPNAADEPLKGEGRKDQRSDKPAGGETGSSKQDKQGNPGSKESGAGDDSQRPGSQKQADSKTGEQGGNKQSGTGSKTEQDGQKKEGGSKEDPSGQGKAEGGAKSEDGKKTADGKPDGGASQQGGEKGAESKDSKNSDQGKPSDDKQGADKKQRGEQAAQKDDGGKPSDSKQGDGQQGKGQGQGQGKNDEGKGQGQSQGKQQGKAPGPPGGKPNGSSNGAAGAGQPVPADNSPDGEGSGQANEIEAAEAANLEFNKRATELVLKRLQDGLERGDVDPELLEQLGWTEAEMKRFADRLSKHLQEDKSGEETPESQARRQQFEEMLKSLDLKKQGAKRTGENSPQREVNQIESRRTQPPQEYRSAYEKFTKELSRQKPASKSTK